MNRRRWSPGVISRALRRKREEAIDRSARGAGSWVEVHGVPAIERAAERHPAGFTTDQVWPLVSVRPDEPRAMGAAVRAASTAGLIVATVEYRQSTDESCNGRPKAVWRKAQKYTGDDRSQQWRRLRRLSGLEEWQCEHGVGHPDEDSVAEMNECTGQNAWGTHGCDGCCQRDDFPGRRGK